MLAHLIYFACCYIYITKDIHTLQTKIVLEVEVFIKFPRNQSMKHQSTDLRRILPTTDNTVVSKGRRFLSSQVYLGRKVIHWTHTVIFYVLHFILYDYEVLSLLKLTHFLPWLLSYYWITLGIILHLELLGVLREPRILTGPAPSSSSGSVCNRVSSWVIHLMLSILAFILMRYFGLISSLWSEIM